MSHNEKRTVWYKEALYSLITGFLYGGTNTISGHPFDTVKTKMQAQTKHMGAKVGYVETIKNVFKQEGPIGFYRGWVPPFFGSVLYRSVQFSVFEAFNTMWEKDEAMRKKIPGTGGLEYRTLCAGFLGGSSRSVIECPFEYAKVKRQTGQSWKLQHIYKGFSTQYPRSTFMMTIYFL